MRRILLGLLTFLSFEMATAGYSECSLMLRDGIYNTFFDRLDSSQISSAHSKICEDYYENGESSGGIGIDFGPVGINLSGSEVNAYGRWSCEENSTYDETIVNDTSFVQLASPEVVNGFVSCLNAIDKGVDYSIEYTGKNYETIASVDIEISLPSDGRLPKLNGVSATPSGAAECTFNSNPVDAGTVMDVGYYNLICEQVDTAVDSLVSISLDTTDSIKVRFNGIGDLHSNEYWDLVDKVNYSKEFTIEKLTKWTPLDYSEIMNLKNISRNTTTCLSLDGHVPSDAKEILVNVYLYSGVNWSRDNNVTFSLYSGELEQEKQYQNVSFHPYEQGAYSFTNENIWVPVADSFDFCASRDAGLGSGFNGPVGVIGYR
jgi:hypothetical protein